MLLQVRALWNVCPSQSKTRTNNFERLLHQPRVSNVPVALRKFSAPRQFVSSLFLLACLSGGSLLLPLWEFPTISEKCQPGGGSSQITAPCFAQSILRQSQAFPRLAPVLLLGRGNSLVSPPPYS